MGKFLDKNTIEMYGTKSKGTSVIAGIFTNPIYFLQGDKK